MTEDVQWGTMEQWLLTSHTPQSLLLSRMLANFLFQIGRALLIGGVAVLLLDLTPFLAPDTVLVFLLTQVAIVGLGFVLAGLHLVYKNVNAITLALSTALLFLTGALAPLDTESLLYTFSHLLPLTAGIHLLRLMVIDGLTLSMVVMNPEFFWMLSVVTVYVIAGILVLSWAHNAARRQGSLAHY
jgi:ABC-2 type transport system permease protein